GRVGRPMHAQQRAERAADRRHGRVPGPRERNAGHQDAGGPSTPLDRQAELARRTEQRRGQPRCLAAPPQPAVRLRDAERALVVQAIQVDDAVNGRHMRRQCLRARQAELLAVRDEEATSPLPRSARASASSAASPLALSSAPGERFPTPQSISSAPPASPAPAAAMATPVAPQPASSAVSPLSTSMSAHPPAARAPAVIRPSV